MPPAATAEFALGMPQATAPSVWQDERFQIPAALLGASVLAVGAFAALHFTVGRRQSTQHPAYDPALGWVFPELGYVLCPQGVGKDPTPKQIRPGTFVVLWLGDPKGRFVETTWAKVLRVDPEDDNRIFVVITGEMTPVGQRPLKEEHGFSLSQSFWMTKDCVAEAMLPLEDPNGVILCGGELITFDGPDEDGLADGLGPAKPPGGSMDAMVGRDVELFFVSRAGKGSAWQVPVRAEVVSVGNIGQVPTVRVKSIESNEFADDPRMGHKLRPGDAFDITWDCVTKYH